MLRLLTFGGLRVVRDDGGATDLANQRRRLAVLAIVASEAPRGVSRERLGFLLWPDAELDKGRHALNQIVYNLRRELGASPIDGGSELSLLPDVMTCDLADFRSAIAQGDHAKAAELYQGTFLDGFHVPGAAEFDRWADEERLRCQRQVVTAIEKLASVSQAENDLPTLVTWTQRLVELDPLSARRALNHMRALEEHGDIGAAIAYGRRYDVLARADGDEADSAVAAEVERLRARPTVAQAAIQATPANRPMAASAPVAAIDAALVAVRDGESDPQGTAWVAAAAGESDAVPRTGAAVPGVSGDQALPPAKALPGVSRDQPRVGAASGSVARRWLLVGAAGVAALLGGMSLTRREGGGALPLSRGDRVLLADVQLPPADSANVRAIAYALQSALQQSSRVHFVSPLSIADALRRMGRTSPAAALPDSTAAEVAEREGARYVLSLIVTPAAASRAVSLRVLDPSNGATVRTYTTVTAATDLLGAIDVVTGQLRRDLGDTQQDLVSAIPLPRATTPSLEALRLYAGAAYAFNRALYKDARTLYEGALVLDSGFAAAHAGLANLAYVYNNVREGDVHMARALALADRLPPRERLLIQATAARGASDWARAATLHRAYLIRYPDDYDIYAVLGYDLMRADEGSEALAAFDSLKAHRTLQASDLLNVASIHSLRGEYKAAREAHVAALRRDTSFLVRTLPNEQIAKALIALGFTDSARQVHAALMVREGLDQARGHRAMAYVDLYEGRYASAIEHLKTSINIYQVDATSALSEARDRALLANALIDVGNKRDATAQLSIAARLGVTKRLPPQALFWIAKPLLRLGEVATGRTLLDSAKARTRSTATDEQAATAALGAEYALARGNAREAVTLAGRALTLEVNMADYADTRAYALEQSGDLTAAREVYRVLGTQLRGAIEIEGQQKARLAPLAVARIDEQLGQPDEARRAVGAFLERWQHADANLPFLTERPLRR